jgi:hypothetical protein
MAQTSTPVEIDPKDLKNAEEGWVSFTQLIKWSAIGIVTTLILMAAFLL